MRDRDPVEIASDGTSAAFSQAARVAGAIADAAGGTVLAENGLPWRRR